LLKTKGEIDRPSPPSEPDHDFVIRDERGKVVGYAEIKTPVDPNLRPMATQAQDIAGHLKSYVPPDPNLQVLVDLKNLTPAQKTEFINSLTAKGVDSATITIVNK